MSVAWRIAARAAGVSAQGVEHHEIVDGAVAADGCHPDSSLRELARVRFTLIAQDVVLGATAILYIAPVGDRY